MMYAFMIEAPFMLAGKIPAGNILFYVFLVFELIMALYLTAGYIDANLQVLNGERLDVTRLYKNFRYLAKFILGLLVLYFIHMAIYLCLLIVLVPVTLFILKLKSTITIFICLGIATIIVLAKLGFIFPLMVDKDLDIIEAVKTSWQMTTGNFWGLVGLLFVFIFIAATGLLALLFGVLIAFPLIFLTYYIVYRKLLTNIPLNNDWDPLENAPSEWRK